MIKGAERAAAAAGLTLVLGDTAENPAAEEQWYAASARPSTASCSAPPGCPTTSCAGPRS